MNTTSIKRIGYADINITTIGGENMEKIELCTDNMDKNEFNEFIKCCDQCSYLKTHSHMSYCNYHNKKLKELGINDVNIYYCDRFTDEWMK